MTPDPRAYVLDVAAAAAYLGLPARAIYRLAERQEIDHLRTCHSVCKRVVAGAERTVRVSGRLKFSRAGLDAWREAHRVPVAASPVRPGRDAAAPTLPPIDVKRFA